MDINYSRKLMSVAIFLILLVLAFMILRPIILSIVIGIILAFLFFPVYQWLYNLIGRKSRDLPALAICLAILIVVFLPFWFLTPIFVQQSIRFYVAVQQTDFITPLKELFPTLFSSEQFSSEIGSILKNFISNTADSAVDTLSSLIFKFPSLSLQFIVVLFTFYFVLRDKEELVEYVRSILPYSKDVEKKFFDYSKGITYSVIYGQVLIGIIQGIIVGIGFFIFGVPNAIFLTLIASLAGILPIVGTVLVWLPVVVFLVISESTGAAIGVTIFGVFSSSIDNLLRPFIVSKTVKIHSGVILIGMIGGLFLFGILGFILGPLILSYLLILLELYRKKDFPEVFFQREI